MPTIRYKVVITEEVFTAIARSRNTTGVMGSSEAAADSAYEEATTKYATYQVCPFPSFPRAFSSNSGINKDCLLGIQLLTLTCIFTLSCNLLLSLTSVPPSLFDILHAKL